VTPTSAARESHQHAVVWKASASRVRLSRARATRCLARASHIITTSETLVRTMPTRLNAARSPVQSECAASKVRGNRKLYKILSTLTPVLNVIALSTDGDYLVVTLKATPWA
jgi:hypothetical protein